MGLRINTNVASLRAQYALQTSTKKVNSAMTRLSTGLRINSGADDVVGLAKSENLRSRIRGIEQARVNIASTSSVLGVAEGYLAELTEVAQTIREIAVQSADDTIPTEVRSSLTDRFNSMMDEYRRLVTNGKFDGTTLLDGTFINKTIQAGTDEGDTITISVDDSRASVIGQVAVLTTVVKTAVGATAALANLAAPAGIIIGTTSIASTDFVSDGTSDIEDADSAIAYVNAINRYTSDTGVTAVVNANVLTVDYTTDSLLGSISLLINGITVKSDALEYTAADDQEAANLVALINEKSSQTGVKAELTSTTADQITLTAVDGRNIHMETANGAAAVNVFLMFGGVAGDDHMVQRGTFRLISQDAFAVTGATAEFNTATTSVSVDTDSALENVVLDDANSAGIGITILDNVIRQLQTRRANIGNAINRLETSENEMASRLENLSAADSRIREADIAAETALLTQFSILQQAGAAVLSQANASPQIALTLLQNL